MKSCIFWLFRPKATVSKAGPLTMKQSIPTVPVLSPVNGKSLLINFDGADMSSDAGLTLLREVERRMSLSGVLASCLADPRDPSTSPRTSEAGTKEGSTGYTETQRTQAGKNIAGIQV